MSIKGRMEVGQTGEDSSGGKRTITGLGRERFFNDYGMDCAEDSQYYKTAEECNWTMTHHADGSAVCEFCGDWIHCLAETRMVPKPGSMNYYCTREKWHDGDHVACTDTNHHNIHTWPQEKAVGGVVKLDPNFRNDPLYKDHPDIAMGYKDYIGWEDDRGILRGLFRLKDQPNSHCYSLAKDQWDSGDWEVIRPVKLWFAEGSVKDPERSRREQAERVEREGDTP